MGIKQRVSRFTAEDKKMILEEKLARVRKETELTVAKHIEKASSDGCQCEPCLAVMRIIAEERRALKLAGVL